LENFWLIHALNMHAVYFPIYSCHSITGAHFNICAGELCTKLFCECSCAHTNLRTFVKVRPSNQTFGGVVHPYLYQHNFMQLFTLNIFWNITNITCNVDFTLRGLKKLSSWTFSGLGNRPLCFLFKMKQSIMLLAAFTGLAMQTTITNPMTGLLTIKTQFIFSHKFKSIFLRFFLEGCTVPQLMVTSTQVTRYSFTT